MMKRAILLVLGVFFLVSACKEVEGFRLEVDGKEVECSSYTGSGSPFVDLRCDLFLNECTDNKIYGLACAYNDENEVIECTCSIDDETVMEFESEESIEDFCPIDPDELISDCNWEL